MQPNVAAAKAAIQGTTASQAPPPVAANTSMPALQGGQLVPTAADQQGSSLTPQIQAAFAPQLQSGELQAQAGYQAGGANVALYNQQQNFNAARSANIASASQQLANIQEASDPHNWKQIKQQDGGFSYQDGTGQPLNFNQYYQGKASIDPSATPASILKGSTNNLDQQAVGDYTNMENITNAWNNNDISALDKVAKTMNFKDSNDLIQAMKYNGIQNPNDLMNAYMNQYPNLFGQSGQGQVRGAPIGGHSTFFTQ